MSGVTAALIVRDEAEYIADCLSSLAGHVDEIILVDTGSRDRTIEIAGRFPVKFYHLRNEVSLLQSLAQRGSAGRNV